MKTSNLIEQQEARREAEKNAVHPAQNSKPVSKAARIERLAPFRFQPGKSGNPGGKPRVDLAEQIARAIFENDGPAIYAAYSKMLRKGSAYAFQVLSDRAFGKLKERHEVELGPYRDLSEEELQQRVVELDSQLGITHETPALPPGDDNKPN